MNLEYFFSQGLNLIGTFDLRIAVSLFLVCLISESIGLSIPYLLETVWLIAGYQFNSRILSPVNLTLLLLTAQAGRQAGAFILYRLSQSGSSLLMKCLSRFKWKTNGAAQKAFMNINFLSPVSVAVGRLLWLRIPLTVFLGARRRLKTLALGVLISSLIWDNTYIIFGSVIGISGETRPTHLILYASIGLGLIYIAGLTARRLFMRNSTKEKALATPIGQDITVIGK